MRFNTHFTLYVSIMALCVIAMAQVSASNLRDPGDRQQFKRVTVSKPNRVWYRHRGEYKLLTRKTEAIKAIKEHKNSRGQIPKTINEHEGTVLGSRALKEKKAKKSNVPKESKKTTKAPKEPKSSKAPGSRALKEKKAKKSKVPKEPKTTKVPKATKAPKEPKSSKAPGSRALKEKKAKKSKVPKTTKVPKVPKVPKAPKSSKVPA
jgi:hypothetical protein